MKIQLLLCFALMASQLLKAQLPIGPDGKALYQKGDCKTILQNVKYKCVFCEDEALTKNCKEYDCSLTECTESKSIKGGDGKMLSKPISIDGRQLKINEDSNTTSKLPKGTKFENGKVVVTSGYKAVQSSDKTMVLLLANDGLGVRGGFRCDCDGGSSGTCNLSIINNKIVCGGDACCELVVTIYDEEKYIAMEAVEKAPEKLKWKKLVFPIEDKQVKFQNNKDSSGKSSVDITEYIKNKKVANGTVVVYETEDKYKIYAIYKKGKLTEWYAMGDDGKKIQSSQLGITPTTCEDCILLPTGQTYCKKCTTTPGVSLPAKRAD
jgi:hypothetical protein